MDFINKYGDEIFPGTPVVFCAIGKRQLENLSFGSNTTGLFVELDISGTLDAALKLQPDTRRETLLIQLKLCLSFLSHRIFPFIATRMSISVME